VIVDWGLVKSKLESRIEWGAKSQSPNGGCGPYINVIDGESSKARGERWLFDGRHGLAVEIDFIDFKVVLSQNGDCKGNIDVVDMVGPNPVFPLLARRETTEVPFIACNAKIWDVMTTDNEEALGRPLV